MGLFRTAGNSVLLPELPTGTSAPPEWLTEYLSLAPVPLGLSPELPTGPPEWPTE